FAQKLTQDHPEAGDIIPVNGGLPTEKNVAVFPMERFKQASTQRALHVRVGFTYSVSNHSAGANIATDVGSVASAIPFVGNSIIKAHAALTVPVSPGRHSNNVVRVARNNDVDLAVFAVLQLRVVVEGRFCDWVFRNNLADVEFVFLLLIRSFHAFLGEIVCNNEALLTQLCAYRRWD